MLEHCISSVQPEARMKHIRSSFALMAVFGLALAANAGYSIVVNGQISSPHTRFCTRAG